MGRPKCEGHKKAHLRFQLTCDEYAQLLSRFGGHCDRCDEVTVAPEIDHDHSLSSSAVRGMVCHQCNCIVGAIEEGRRREDQLTAEYLSKPFHRQLAEFRPDSNRGRIDHRIPDLVGAEGAAKVLRLTRWVAREELARARVRHVVIDGRPIYLRSAVEELARAVPRR